MQLTPVILSDDTIALKVWKLRADSARESPQLLTGYESEASDVEHAADFVSDAAPVIVLYGDDEVLGTQN